MAVTPGTNPGQQKNVAMKKKVRSFYLVITSLFIGVLHLPFAFAKTAAGSKFVPTRPIGATTKTKDPDPEKPVAKSVYDSLQLRLKGLSAEAYNYAKEGFDKLLAQGRLLNDSIISVIDFSKPSNEKRLYVLDMKNYKVLFNSLVAHGQNTGREWATSFSNENETHKSSPGFYITQGTYEGKNGFSMRLEGVERGINDKALERGIVMHGADYVNQDIANSRGWVGRSHGCPAVPVELNRPIINKIKNGSCLFIYHPSYVERSAIL